MKPPTLSASKYILRISREYGMYVLDTRAIPAMTDGLKTGQRIALYLLRSKQDKIKTIALAGQMIASELYVHGDVAAADTISMLAGPFCNNRPTVHGIGAFGTRAAPTSFAAPRYTYVKRSKFATDVLYVDTDIVPMVENTDGSATMPGTFLPLLPLVLLNGPKGVATGWASKILPRRFEDLVGAVDDVLNNKPVRELMPYYEGRDATILRDPTDRNKYIISGKAERKNTTTILVTELPPELSLEKFRERLAMLEEDGKIVGFQDRTTENISIQIKMTRTALAKLTDIGIIEFLKLRSLVTENMVVQGIGGGKIINYESAEELVVDWVKWRGSLYLDRFLKLLADEKVTNLYWRYIIACFNGYLKTSHLPMPERAPELTVPELRDYVVLLGKLNKLAMIPKTTLDSIMQIPIYRWTLEGYQKALKELDDSDKRIIEYGIMIKSDTKRKNLFKKEVGALV